MDAFELEGEFTFEFALEAHPLIPNMVSASAADSDTAIIDLSFIKNLSRLLKFQLQITILDNLDAIVKDVSFSSGIIV